MGVCAAPWITLWGFDEHHRRHHWWPQLLSLEHSGVKKFDYTANSMLTFRDPDNIQLEFFWRASA